MKKAGAIDKHIGVIKAFNSHESAQLSVRLFSIICMIIAMVIAIVHSIRNHAKFHGAVYTGIVMSILLNIVGISILMSRTQIKFLRTSFVIIIDASSICACVAAVYWRGNVDSPFTKALVGLIVSSALFNDAILGYKFIEFWGSGEAS